MKQAGNAARTPERIIDAALALWESQGGALSARALGQLVSSPASSIYYHFGNLEHLSLCAQQSAIDQARLWCARQIEQVPEQGGPFSIAPVMAEVMVRLCRDERRLAFAWRECQLQAGRDAQLVPALRQWDRLWLDFWTTICARCGHGADGAGQLTAWFTDGESLLHLMQGETLLDRACLDESCRGWESWLNGRMVGEGPWRRHARSEAAQTLPPLSEPDAMAAQMAEAAAAIISEQGTSALTHRAVAARAGVTLGVVSYRFPTSTDLLHAAFEAIYRQLVPFEPEAMLAKAEALAAGRPDGDTPPLPSAEATSRNLRAMQELFVAVARGAGLRHFARQLRYLRGRSSARFLRAAVGRDVSPLDAALFSALSTGQLHAAIGFPARERDDGSARLLRTVTHLLGRT